MKIEQIKEEINLTSADILSSGTTTTNSVTLILITVAFTAINNFFKKYFQK